MPLAFREAMLLRIAVGCCSASCSTTMSAQRSRGSVFCNITFASRSRVLATASARIISASRTGTGRGCGVEPSRLGDPQCRLLGPRLSNRQGVLGSHYAANTSGGRGVAPLDEARVHAAQHTHGGTRDNQGRAPRRADDARLPLAACRSRHGVSRVSPNGTKVISANRNRSSTFRTQSFLSTQSTRS